MLREILIVTTFKEFDGSRAAQIQEFWLDHLHRQTYKNFRLVVTNFREKNVERALEKSNLSFEFFQSTTECLYSIADMYENTIKLIKQGEQIILFPSPDHLFDDNFFEVIANTFHPGVAGTSFPHPQHLSIEDYKNNVMYDEASDRYLNNIFAYDPNKSIPEAVFFDADFLLEKNWQLNFFRDRISGTFPGICIHLFMLSSSDNLINLIFKTRVHKIISHVNPSNNKLDMVNYLSEAHKNLDIWNQNEEILMAFCKFQKLKKKLYQGTAFRRRKLVMFSRFRPIGSITEKISYYLFLIRFTIFPLNEFIIISKIKSAFKKLF